MIFAAISVWLLLILLMAWGVHHLWGTITKPKAVNAILLPGTFVAQLGHIVGLLISGAKVNNTSLMSDDKDGTPAAESEYEPGIPVFGPVIAGLFPMLITGAAIYLVLTKLGMPVVASVPQDKIATELPGSLGAFWNQLRSLITLSEATLDSVRNAQMPTWQMVTFVYLMICLTVRMAPLPGNAHGHVAAIAAMGCLLALIGTVSVGTAVWVERAWPLLSLTVGWLLLLLMVSLVARGLISTVRALAHWT